MSDKKPPSLGKAYANRKRLADRPPGDLYPTPRSLIWVAKDIIHAEFDQGKTVLEPCSGQGAISSELRQLGYQVVENDLFFGGVDYLTHSFDCPYIITNPPFSKWNPFVKKAKQEAEKVMMIGRLNYFGTTSRLTDGIWDGLKSVYCFDRYVDYRTPERSDGLFKCGAMATAWFLWEDGFVGDPSLHFLSVQKYTKLNAACKVS
jgi:hypothetical protein